MPLLYPCPNDDWFDWSNIGTRFVYGVPRELDDWLKKFFGGSVRASYRGCAVLTQRLDRDETVLYRVAVE
ncbi:hypothetical protein EGR_09861 [Echinococcus granulosus]|uniref:Uncharacterized protein n=1 Tax=Echinococcus granulosus TaxID=6210 RepID=W6UPE7_ECHGR|nr:hypothetical protein EGR_09859 [Echinococcus granulosus]XP_024346492.1 hypothetical protein EGR_09861 [Echinococcus granulosus]EUB55294.1 hypothetical protein EGR_09859 [Echinococcus granulosus]EUB55296.1 hypothetical protein EGR_09861 [Echinococcus granulosus]